jgi:hypothetical protein
MYLPQLLLSPAIRLGAAGEEFAGCVPFSQSLH